MKKLCVIVCLVLLVLAPCLSWAQTWAQNVDMDAAKEIPLPREVPSLPEPNGSERPFYVTADNVALFHEILIEPLATWLKEGKFVLRVQKRLNFQWNLSEDWKRGTAGEFGRYNLDDENNVILDVDRDPEAGYPFGMANSVDQESDPGRKAYKILWNIAYAEVPTSDVMYGIDLAWVGSRHLSRRCSGLFYRRIFSNRYAQSLPQIQQLESKEKPGDESVEPSDNGNISSAATVDVTPLFSGPGDILRQDVLKILSPPVVFGYSEVGWRYRAGAEDKVWIYSPVIGRNRMVLGANRSDPFIGSELNSDDIFVWSGKIQATNARVVDEKVMLVPYSYSSIIGLDNVKSFSRPLGHMEKVGVVGRPSFEDLFSVVELHERTDGSSASMLWNHETRRFPKAMPWVPTEAVFVPRNVWIIELSPRDPFYLAGRQILVVEKESMLPIYKIVYGRDGTYKKTVMGSWGLASSRESGKRLPFSAFVLSVPKGAQLASTITSHSIQTFLGQDTAKAREVRALLDISSHDTREETPSSKAP